MQLPVCLTGQSFLKKSGWTRLLVLGFAIALISSCMPIPSVPMVQSSPTQSSPSPISPTDAPPTQIATPNSSISFQVLPVGRSPLSTRSTTEPQLLVFQNQQDWAKFWNSNSLPDTNPKKITVPPVDFSHQQAIAVTLGSRPTGGFRIQIDQIEKLVTLQRQEWVVHYTEKVPGADCFVTQQTTTPTIFLLTAASDAPIRMQGKIITDSCNS